MIEAHGREAVKMQNVAYSIICDINGLELQRDTLPFCMLMGYTLKMCKGCFYTSIAACKCIQNTEASLQVYTVHIQALKLLLILYRSIKKVTQCAYAIHLFLHPLRLLTDEYSLALQT